MCSKCPPWRQRWHLRKGIMNKIWPTKLPMPMRSAPHSPICTGIYSRRAAAACGKRAQRQQTHAATGQRTLAVWAGDWPCRRRGSGRRGCITAVSGIQTLYGHLKNQFAENKSCPATIKGRAGTLDAASKPRALGRSACLCSLLDLGNGMVAEAAAPQALRRGCDGRFGSSRGGCCDGNVQLAALQRHMSVRS